MHTNSYPKTINTGYVPICGNNFKRVKHISETTENPLTSTEGTTIASTTFEDTVTQNSVPSGTVYLPTWTQSYDFDLQRQRCKFFQRNL
jgi:hypothetical protein